MLFLKILNSLILAKNIFNGDITHKCSHHLKLIYFAKFKFTFQFSVPSYSIQTIIFLDWNNATRFTKIFYLKLKLSFIVQ